MRQTTAKNQCPKEPNERIRALSATCLIVIPPDLERLLESALAVHPSDGLALSTLGALAMQQGRTTEAVQYLTQARNVPFAEESAVAGLLDLSYQQANWAKSLEYVDRCIEIDPGHPGYHAIRADVLMNSGRQKEGITAAEKSLELDPTRIPVRAWLAGKCLRKRRSKSGCRRNA